MALIVDDCRYCQERPIDLTRDDWGDPYRQYDEALYCSDDCRDNASEAAYERSMEDYYGGGGPVTIDEQCAAARAQKEGR